MKYHTLAIAITDKCDISCDMCCEKGHKSDQNNKKNFRKNIVNYVKTIDCADMIKYVALTGGEVFQEKELMKEIINIAKKNHKKTSIMTNGNWCSDYNTAIYEISALKEVGLDMLGISYDSYHKKYVDNAKIINILKACKKMNIQTNIQMCLDKDTRLDDILGEIKEHMANTTMSFVNCMPVGGGVEKIDTSKLIRNYYDSKILCQKSSSFLISYDGRIFPCCSPMAYRLDLDFGNIKEDDICSTLKRLQKNVFLYMLRNYGFQFYIETANKLNIELPQKIVSPCEICAIVLSKKNVYKFLPYIFEKIQLR